MRPRSGPPVLSTPLLALALAALAALPACGAVEETLTVRGDFADPAGAPAAVRAEEAGREAQVADGAFELKDLSVGPVTLRLVSGGDVLGTIDLPDIPAGGAVTLHGLRVDETSGRAFPRTVEVRGGDVVRVNGVRMAAPDRLPDEVDEEGAVLAFAPGSGALLVRPANELIPDLRVFLGAAAETITPDGDPVSADALAPGDSVRVQGRTVDGYVIASRLTVPRRLATSLSSAGEVSPDSSPDDGASADEGSGDTGGGGDDDGGGSASAGGSTVAAAPAAPVVRASPRVRQAVRERVREERKAARGNRGGGRGNGGGKKP